MERPAPRLPSFRLSPILLARHRLPRARHGTLVQVVLYLGSCIETLYRPNRSPFSEITSLASSTAVLSVLPLPKRMPRSSALESASGPSESRRSRGLSSGGSCFMVYRRPIHSHSITERRDLVPADPEALQHPHRQREWQPDNVGVVAPDPLHEHRGPALDGVSSRLAHALPQARVGFYLFLAGGPHLHLREGVAHHQLLPPGNSHPRMDLVDATAQEQEHPAHLLVAPGLAQDTLAVWQINDRVRREDDVVRVSGDGECLAAGIGLDGRSGIFQRQLGEAALHGLEVVADSAEQVYAPGRLGGEDEPHSLRAEEEIQLPGGALWGVGAVDQVVRHTQGQVPAEGTGGGVGGVGRAHEGTHRLDGALAPNPHRDDGGRGDELDQLLEEGLLAVLGVVLLGEFAAHIHEPEGADVEALVLYAADDLADEPATDAITLHQHQGLFQGLSPFTNRSSCRYAGGYRSTGRCPTPC